MSKDLIVNIKADVTDFDNALRRISQRINDIQNQANNLNNGFKQQRKVASAASKSIDDLNVKYQFGAKVVTGLIGKLKHLAQAYLGVMGMQAMITSSDAITSAENKLNYINAQQLGNGGYVNGDIAQGYSHSTLNATQEDMDKMYASAQKVRMGYTDMMANVSKSMTLAGDSFQNNTDNAIRFQEIMAEAYALGGASAAEMSSSMYQMIQALGSGILQGDELRSVREGAPLAYQELEKFAQKIYETDESLADLASQGKITSDIVVAAMMDAGEGIDAAFANTNMTFAQAFQSMRNTSMKAFEPVLQMLNDGLNSDVGRAIIEGVGNAIIVIANLTLKAFNIIGAVATWMYEQWSWLQYIVLALIFILLILGVAIIAAGIYALWTTSTFITMAASALTAWMSILWPILLVIAVIGILIAIAVACGATIEQICGAVVGYFMWVYSVTLNIFIGLINAIIQFFYSYFVEPIAGIVEWFVNAFTGGFNGIVGAAINSVGQVVSIFLSGFKVITKAIDAVAGTELTAKITSAQDWVKGWGKKENAVTYSVEAPELSRIYAKGAFNKGYYGTQDFMTDTAEKFNTLTTLPSVDDPAYDVTGAYTAPTNYDELIKGIGDTAKNTGKMADSMDVAEEDLEYLRGLADMEWKKEFTTASIKVDMSNTNTINNQGDLDGWVTLLTDKLYEELSAVADGAYT